MYLSDGFLDYRNSQGAKIRHKARNLRTGFEQYLRLPKKRLKRAFCELAIVLDAECRASIGQDYIVGWVEYAT